MLLETGPAVGLETATWEFIRASGLLAFVLLSVSVFLGLAVNVRALDPLTKRVYVYEGHQTISILALALMILHVVLLLVHKFVDFTLTEILVPFASDWRPMPVALGIACLYLTVLLIGSSYARNSIGQKTWRALHYSSFVAWILAVFHGITAGSDSTAPLVQYLYLATIGPVVLLICFRAIAPSGHPDPRRITATPRGALSVPANAEAAAPPGPSAR